MIKQQKIEIDLSDEEEIEFTQRLSQFDAQNQTEVSPLKFFTLTAVLLGLQFIWTIEMSFGTPYLFSFGIPHNHLMIVWLCGPLSGLIMQPIVGILSDNCTSRFGKRRPFIIIGYCFIAVSLIMIAYARDINVAINSVNINPFYLSSRDDSEIILADNAFSISLVVIGFFILDFAINVVQAASRALILDVLPEHFQNHGNSWASGMISLGNILGYLSGSLDLSNIFFKTGTHIQVLSLLGLIVLTLSLLITCTSTKEKRLQRLSQTKSLSLHLSKLYHTMFNLPLPIKNICMVQLFAWIGWFPFNFFSTELLKEIALAETYDLDPLNAARYGSRALLFLSIVSSGSAFILPRIQRVFKLNPTKLWTISLYWFSMVLISSPVLLKIYPPITWTTIAIASVGVPLCVTLWVPFQLIGVYLMQHQRSMRNIRRKPDRHTDDINSRTSQQDLSNGTILGIHNIYIVVPQIVSSLISSIMFTILQDDGTNPQNIAFVWMFSGLFVLYSAFLSIKCQN